MPPKGNHGHGGAAAGRAHPDNHGADVSAVAHVTPRGRGADHGQAVSEAAHSERPDTHDRTPASDQPSGNGR